MEEEKVEVVEPEEETEKAVPTSGGSGSKRKRSPQKIEKLEQPQRTPLKRQRNPVKLFQSPAEQEKAVMKTPKAGPSKEEAQLLYRKGSFLALRGDDGSFFLCRLNQNVTTGKSRQFKLNWLSLTNSPNTYKLDYMDKQDIDSILTNIHMDRVSRDVFELPEQEKERINKVLSKTLKFVAGDIVDEDLEEEEEAKKQNDFADGEESEDEPPAKKSRTTGSESKKKSDSKAKGNAAQKKEKEKDRKRKEKGAKKGRGPDRNLRPNPKIKVLEKDPFFEMKDKGPFVSIPVQSKQVYCAVSTGDMSMLKELIESEKVFRLDMTRSPGVKETPLECAMRKNAVEAMETLITDVLDTKVKKPRLEKGPPVMLMQATGTGRYNPVYLGIGAIRALNVSRGSKEGNNAFAKDEMQAGHYDDYYVARAIEMGVSPATLDRFIVSLTNALSDKRVNKRDDVMEECFGNIHLAIENGHRETAAKLVSEAVRIGGYGFNFLHEEVLKFENEDLRENILGASVRKKPFDNRAITPLHCSAINPNVKYLTRLLGVEPDINLMDRSHRRPIHYAAACSGTKPLELLLSKGASVTDMDTQGNLPLHRACATGRANNVTVLLKHAATNRSADDMTINKWGFGGINRSNRNSYCPIHLAVTNGHMEVLKVLLKNEVNVNKPVSASKNKLTPLMMAAERGCLDMVRLLVQSGASVELLDKLKRSALTHAIINGNTNVASYLLYLGADPDRKDSSGNSLVHYAAAYGWYHCLKLLIKDAGAVYNVDNDWKTTPLAIAFLKGHPGIVDYLLSQPETDINFKDDKGMTLVSIAASSRLQPGLEDQMSYLVKEKKADPTIPDLEGYTALHHLCANNIKLKGSQWSPMVCEKAMDTSLKVANILLDAGCDISQPSNVGKTPVSLALDQVNFKLVEMLVQQGGEIPTEKNEEEKNVLHTLAEQCCTSSMTPLLHILAGQNLSVASGDQQSTAASGEEKMEVDAITDGAGDASNAQPPAEPRQSLKDALKKMAADTDFLGFTPLLRACQVYRTYQVPRNPGANRVENDQKNGRDFIQALIDVAGSDVNAAVKEKNIPDTKEPTYVKEGKYTPTHMMVSCQTEMPVKEGQVEVKHPGLALILRYSPDLEQKNLNQETPLVMAVRSKSAELVKLLAEKGANPNVVFNHGSTTERLITPCLWLASERSLLLVRLFLRYGADPKAVCCDTKQTLMHLLVHDRAAEGEVIELLKTLLDKGLGVNDRDSNDDTPLHVAVSNNKGDANDSTLLEEFLLEQKANIFAKNKGGQLPIHCVFHRCGPDPIELLSLVTAAMKDQQVDEPDSNGNTPLHLAATSGATICCMHLLQRRAQINRKNKTGNTPLTLSVQSGRDSCAIMLLQQTASVDDEIVVYDPKFEVEKPPEPKPPAPAKKEKPVLKWRPLEKQMQKKEPVEKKRIAHTIFQGAIASELQGVAHLLLDKTGIGFAVIEAALNVNKFNVVLRLLKRVVSSQGLQGMNKDNQTLLHVLALKTKTGGQEELQLQVAEALLKRDVPVDTVDHQRCTAVQYCAILHQPVALARLLIEKSKAFDAKAKDKMGRDMVAAVMWDYEWVSNVPSKAMAWLDLLIEKGLSLDTQFDRPLPDVLLFGARLDAPCPDYFAPRVKGSETEKISPLILAIRHYNVGLARYLLKKGASVNFKDSKGYTPLIHAVKMNDMTMIKLLFNQDYVHDKEERASQIIGASDKPVLVKKFSRNIFLIKTDKRAEEMEKDPSVDEDAGEDDSEDNVEQGIDDDDEMEDKEDDNIEDVEDVLEEDMEEEDLGMNGDVGEGNEEEEEEEQEGDDSDHDTDLVEDDDDDEPAAVPVAEAPPRLGSKQKSLVKVNQKEKPEPYTCPVAVTSDINLNDKDPQGKTALHHTVSSLDFGTFDNGEIIKLLWSAGAILNVADVQGCIPKDLALMSGANRIYEALLLRTDEREKQTLQEFTVKDGLLEDKVKVDFGADAEAVVTDLDKDGSGEATPPRPKVDSNCEMRTTGEVYQDETKKVTYDITLTKVDVATGAWGMYNFYKLQIVRQKAKDMYVLFTRWGRIGDRGQWQHTPFPTAEDAIKEFCKVFRQKTGNDWNHVDRFVAQKKKYRLMPTMEEPKRKKEVKFDFQSPLPTNLNPGVVDLLQELTNVTMLQASAKSKGLDEDFMPFGRIVQCSLDKAKDILLELEKLIATVDLQQKNLTTTPMEEYQANCEKVAAMTNDFYHLVQVGGYEYEAIRPIRDKKVLKEHFRLVSDLMDMEVACKILLGSQRRLPEMNPYEYIYRSIGCKIQPMSESEDNTQAILTYINASGHGCKVNAVYKVARPKEYEDQYRLGLHNHRLLWHGTSMANIVSILSRGLLVAPANAPVTGNLFGEGVYFADCFTKSRNYCYNAVGSCKVMLLCEVALGNSLEDFSHDEEDHLSEDVHSLKILGKMAPDPDFDIVLPYGPTIPLGQLKPMTYEGKTPMMQYNEYVVHNPQQICIRYVVMFDG